MSTTSDPTTQVIRHHWDRRAGTFDDELGHGLLVSNSQRLAWLNLLSRFAGEAPRRILDVGCGTGFVALRLAELGHIVTGIDLSPQMIDRACSKAKQMELEVKFQVGDAADVDCADATYDIVVGRHLIWNLPEPERGVAEWLRVLRPGGRLVLIEGKWGDNRAMELSYGRWGARIAARVIEAAAAAVLRSGAYRAMLLRIRYRSLEVRLPFSGGPSAARLTELLEAHSVREIVVEPLMDPLLWGEVPRFPRYIAAGTRPPTLEPAP